jgi:hypothetical protein
VIRFTSVSVPAGISPSVIGKADPLRHNPDDDFTLTPTFARIDSDLYPDILSVADYNRTQFFSNNGDGTFRNATDNAVVIDDNGMGSAVGDYDDDGDLDWFVTSVMDPGDTIGNRFYENVNGSFVDRTSALGVASGGWGWGACFVDFENDGDLDIFHTNGWSQLERFRSESSRAFEQLSDGRFANSAAIYGFDQIEQGRGVVCADFDNDGDVDIFELHRNSTVAATLWRNGSDEYNSLTVRLNGKAPNTEAAGARIYATVGSVTRMREIMIGSNFVSQNPTAQVIGLGTATQVDSLRVQWPDGQETRMTAVAAGQRLAISHPDL